MTPYQPEMESALRLGVSSCLLGQKVRFDGGHKRSRFVTDQLDEYVEWVPVCPEVEIGMGVPRASVRLVRDGGVIRMLEPASGRDHTRNMRRYAIRRARELRKLELCGYILKKDSPSCGMTRVKVFGKEGMPQKNGTGMFASALMEACPSLPVEEEGRLNDARLRDNFIERIFAYRRLRGLFRGRWTRGRVVSFHTAHKLQLMAHSTVAYRRLGQLVARIDEMTRPNFRSEYEQGFMQTLSTLATRGRNANVLQHAAGHLKKRLDASSRKELSDLIHDYRNGLVPLVVPMTLIRHHVRVHHVDYLGGQVFLEPHPKELMLRNHV